GGPGAEAGAEIGAGVGAEASAWDRGPRRGTRGAGVACRRKGREAESMYRNCIFCSRDLGRNESIESFQVGARLAFDSWRGRLWVVCPACGRWNLTPLEERWEAVEACERLFRDTRMRVQRENIGLAKLEDG